MSATLPAADHTLDSSAPPVADTAKTLPRWHRFVGVAALAVGAALVVAPVAADGFGRASAGERLITEARPAVGPEGIVQLRADTDLVIDVGGSILDEVIPALGAALGRTDEQTRQLVDERFPSLAEASARKVELGTALDKTVTNLEAHADDFGRADAIPFAGAHPAVMPIGAILTGVALAVSGWLLLATRPARRTRRRHGPLLAVTVIGGLMVVIPLGLQLPQKAAAAESLLASLTTTEENATRTREQFDLTTAAAVEVRTQLVPEAAAALGTTPDGLIDALQREFAGLAGLDELDPALERIEADVRFREERLGDFARVKPVPMAAISWIFVALGAGLAIAGAAASSLTRRRER